MANETVSDEVAGAAFDALHAKLKQLQAMLLMTYGEANESFSSMNKEMRDNYLWACENMAGDCVTLTQKFVPKGF